MKAVTKLYVQLLRLEALTHDDETAAERAAWLQNLDSSGVRANGYTLEERDGGPLLLELNVAEMQQVDSSEAVLYNFIGNEGECERFYAAEDTVYKRGALYYVEYREDIDVF